MNDERQTLLGVTGSIVLAIIAFSVMPVLLSDAEMTVERLPERIFSGTWFAITSSAWKYSRLPHERRLSPVHAIGLGGLLLIMTSWFIIYAPASAERRWLAVVGPALLAIPGVYLMVMGTRAIRAAELEARE